MRKVTGQPLKSEAVNADRKVVETTQELIALFKREFGEDWKNAFSQTVKINYPSFKFVDLLSHDLYKFGH